MATTQYPTSKGYKPNGVLNLPLGWRGGFITLSVVGGPYDGYADFAKANDAPFGVCVRAEAARGLSKHAHLPIEDFSVPEDPDRVRAVLKQALRAALDGRDVYVGCMGGWGRTGLFLALMAKAAGIPDPVGYVKATYSHRAVETNEQARFVEDFDVGPLRGYLLRRGWLKRLGLG